MTQLTQQITKTVAVLGLGAMGSRIANNLIEAGYSVTVWNRSPDAARPFRSRGVTVASSPREAAEQADVVLSMVSHNEASKAVWLAPDTGAALGLKAGAIAIECSTLTVQWTQLLDAEITRHNSLFLAAPVVGSRPQAEAKKLICLVGGKAQTLAQVEEILSATAGAIHHIGHAGQAMAMKLAVNALFSIQVAALGEALGLLSKLGLNKAQAMNYLNHIPIISPAAKGAGALMIADNHDPMFPISLVKKDLSYASKSAQAVGAIMPSTDAVGRLYERAIAQNHGAENITGIANLF